MDITFSTDMQSTKDTTYIFNESNIKLLYMQVHYLFICIFCVWNYLAVYYKPAHVIQSNKKKQRVISYSKKQ